jgi:hypothetical protein
VNEAVDIVLVSEYDDGKLRLSRTPVRPRCQDRQGVEKTSGTPARVPGAFVVGLVEDTGMMDRGEAEVLLSILVWVEVEVRGFPDVLERMCRLRGAVMKAAACGAGRVG